MAAAAGCQSDHVKIAHEVDGQGTGGTNSSSDPCANFGCSPPPLCSTGCLAQCGCCSCGWGEIIEISGKLYECMGPCYAPYHEDDGGGGTGGSDPNSGAGGTGGTGGSDPNSGAGGTGGS